MKITWIEWWEKENTQHINDRISVFTCVSTSLLDLLGCGFLKFDKSLHKKISKYHRTLGHLSSDQWESIWISKKLTKHWGSLVLRILKIGPKSIIPNIKIENGPLAHLASYLTKVQEKTFSRNLPQAMYDIMAIKACLWTFPKMTCRLLYYTQEITSGPQLSGTTAWE